MSDLTLGLDLSDGPIRLVVLDTDGEVAARDEAPHAAAAGVRAAVVRASKAGTISRIAVALSQPGEPIPDDMAAMLRQALPKAVSPLAVAAGTAACVAEHWRGAGQGLAQLATFSIGEHVTSGILLDGRPWEGAHGLAGSVGWLALNPVEREDYRRFGGLEAEVASAGIVRRLVWRVKSGDRSAVAEQVGGDLTRLTAEHIFQGARVGDGVCISVVRDTAKYVGMAVANLVTIFDPEAVVLGGMLASSGDMMLEAIRLECSRRVRPAQAEHARVVLSSLGPDAVAIGAARLAGGA